MKEHKNRWFSGISTFISNNRVWFGCGVVGYFFTHHHYIKQQIVFLCLGDNASILRTVFHKLALFTFVFFSEPSLRVVRKAAVCVCLCMSRVTVCCVSM